MEFSPDDFKDMKWPIYSIPLGRSVVNEIPFLKVIFLGVSGIYNGKELNEDKIIRFIIYSYHKKSPLVKTIDHVINRKKEAMALIGIKPGPDGYFSDEVNKVIANENDAVVAMIHEFVKSEKGGMAYAELIALNDSYEMLLKTLKTSDVTKDHLSIQKDLNVIRKNINALGEEVFAGDIDVSEMVGIVQKMEKARKMKIYPEDYALPDEDN